MAKIKDYMLPVKTPKRNYPPVKSVPVGSKAK